MAAPSRPFSPRRSSPRPFSPRRVLADLGNDRDALHRMIDAYRSELDDLLAALAEALDAGDPAALAVRVHRLRGSFAVLHAERGRRLAAEIEDWLDGGHLPPRPLTDRLAREARRLGDALGDWRAANPV
jgi:HPt (histidine-containing phosphotransfer) domain-containing protein